mgnify:CR=1 FL=1
MDGGPTKNTYLMQFQSDMLGSEVLVSDSEEMSAIGAACAADRAWHIAGRCDGADQKDGISSADGRRTADKKWNGWKRAVVSIL